MKIAEILEASPVDPERHLNPGRVENYRRSIDRLAPVVVFETDDGPFLADGYHRVAAALKEGRETVEVDLRRGSRHDALEYAAVVGAAQRGLSPEEAREHILRHRP